EEGRIVYMPRCPVALPPEEDLRVLRNDLAGQMTRKNVSYHPEADSVRGLAKNSPVYPTTHRVLTTLRDDIATWARRMMPDLLREADIGTCSFRPQAEAGRTIDPPRAGR